jgi:hypothetical protein
MPLAAEPIYAVRRARRRPGPRRDILTLSLVERGGLVFLGNRRTGAARTAPLPPGICL